MSRRLAVFVVSLAATVAFILGLIAAGGVPRPSGRDAIDARHAGRRSALQAAGLDFADIASRINPSVVSIEAASRSDRHPHDGGGPRRPGADTPGGHESDPEGGPDEPQGGSGTGFIVEPDGHILTNFHVIEGADRILVKLASGRQLRARVVGTDPATDLAVVKVDAGEPLAAAPLGDSAALRVGEWVCAIGNPLEYEHTVTVGVVSSLGRKLFDPSLDDYIQTDAAINFGNSGGPLINARGEVIGINAAISWRASSIGFAIPINQARAILPQMKATGRVSRGFMGVTLRELDPDLAQTLGLGPAQGALVQDVAAGSPGERAGIRPYDLIQSVDGRPVATNDDLIRRIAVGSPGSTVVVGLLRDGTPQRAEVQLSERPLPEDVMAPPSPERREAPPDRASSPAQRASALVGLTVRALDRGVARRLNLPAGLRGVVAMEVEPMGPAEEAGVEHGDIVLEINRQPVASPADFVRLVAGARPGDVLAFYCYVPALEQRALRALRLEPWPE